MLIRSREQSERGNQSNYSFAHEIVGQQFSEIARPTKLIHWKKQKRKCNLKGHYTPLAQKRYKSKYSEEDLLAAVDDIKWATVLSSITIGT